MITVTMQSYNGASFKVQVSYSVTQNPDYNDTFMDAKEITIEIDYTNYREEVAIDQGLSFQIPLEDCISCDNIYEGEFRDYVEEYLGELDVDQCVRPMTMDAIAVAYVRIVENYYDQVGPCSVTMFVNVEIDLLVGDDDVQGPPFEDDTVNLDIDDDDYDNSGTVDDNVGKKYDEDEIRAILIKSGVIFQKATSSVDGCVVCLDKVVGMEDGGGDDVAVLPCSHVYHGHCIVEMVAKADPRRCVPHTCPLCRFKLE